MGFWRGTECRNAIRDAPTACRNALQAMFCASSCWPCPLFGKAVCGSVCRAVLTECTDALLDTCQIRPRIVPLSDTAGVGGVGLLAAAGAGFGVFSALTQPTCVDTDAADACYGVVGNADATASTTPFTDSRDDEYTCVDGFATRPGGTSIGTLLNNATIAALLRFGGLGGGAGGWGGNVADWTNVPRCDTRGDPRIRTFDGDRYSFQARGDFVFASSSELTVQTRFGFCQPDQTFGATCVDSLAAKFSHRTSTVYLRVGPRSFDGNVGVVQVRDDGATTYRPITVPSTVVLALGRLKNITVRAERLFVTARTSGGGWRVRFDAAGVISVIPPATTAAGDDSSIGGLCGNYNGNNGDDRTSATKRQATSERDTYVAMATYRTPESDSLFDYTAPNTYEEKNSITTLEGGSSDFMPTFTDEFSGDVAAFEQRCSSAGLERDSDGWRVCVDDLIVSNGEFDQATTGAVAADSVLRAESEAALDDELDRLRSIVIPAPPPVPVVPPSPPTSPATPTPPRGSSGSFDDFNDDSIGDFVDAAANTVALITRIAIGVGAGLYACSCLCVVVCVIAVVVGTQSSSTRRAPRGGTTFVQQQQPLQQQGMVAYGTPMTAGGSVGHRSRRQSSRRGDAIGGGGGSGGGRSRKSSRRRSQRSMNQQQMQQHVQQWQQQPLQQQPPLQQQQPLQLQPLQQPLQQQPLQQPLQQQQQQPPVAMGTPTMGTAYMQRPVASSSGGGGIAMTVQQ